MLGDALVVRRLQLLADAMLRSADVMRHMIGGKASLRRVASRRSQRVQVVAAGSLVQRPVSTAKSCEFYAALE